MTEQQKQELEELKERAWLGAERHLDGIKRLAKSGLPSSLADVSLIQSVMCHVAGLIHARIDERKERLESN